MDYKKQYKSCSSSQCAGKTNGVHTHTHTHTHTQPNLNTLPWHTTPKL